MVWEVGMEEPAALDPVCLLGAGGVEKAVVGSFGAKNSNSIIRTYNF